MSERKTIQEFDLARVVSMLAVIMIHVTAPYLGRTSDFTVLGITPAFFLNQVTRFAVPLFILLSGASLGFSRSASDLTGFYKKRAKKIGIPYLVWFCLYYVYNLVHTVPTPQVTVRGFLRSLLQGQSAPHLYFIIVAAQCYLVYPLLKKAVQRAPGWTVALSLLVTSAMQLLLALRRAGFNYIPDMLGPYLWLLLPTWIFYFTLGMALTEPRICRLRQFAADHTGSILAGVLAFMGLYVLQSKAFHALDSMKLLLNLYVPVLLLGAFALWRLIGRFRWVRSAVRFLSSHAMTIYFGHVFVVYHFREWDRFTRGMSGMMELYLVVTLLSIPLAWLLDTAGALVFSGRRQSGK